MERMKDMSSTAMSAPHTLVIEDRKRLSVSGVTDVESFDEETVALATELGELIIHGYDLHINRIDVESGDLSLEGEIISLTYTDNQPQPAAFSAVCSAKGGMFRRDTDIRSSSCYTVFAVAAAWYIAQFAL